MLMDDTQPTRPRELLLPYFWRARDHLDELQRPQRKRQEVSLWTWPLGRAARPLLKEKVVERVLL